MLRRKPVVFRWKSHLRTRFYCVYCSWRIRTADHWTASFLNIMRRLPNLRSSSTCVRSPVVTGCHRALTASCRRHLNLARRETSCCVSSLRNQSLQSTKFDSRFTIRYDVQLFNMLSTSECNLPHDSKTDKSSSWMRYPNVTWRIILPVYLFTTELRHTCIVALYFSK